MQGDYVLVQQHLGELKSNYKKQQEEASDPQTQHQKVWRGIWVSVESHSISHWTSCVLIGPPLLSHITFVIHTPKQPPTTLM